MATTASTPACRAELPPDPGVLREHIRQVGNEVNGVVRRGQAQEAAGTLRGAVDELRLVWMALRRLAVVPDSGKLKARITQERTLRQAVDTLKGSLDRLSQSSEEAAAIIDLNASALDTLETLDEGGELTACLRTVTDGFRSATSVITSGIRESRTDLAASEEIVDGVKAELAESEQESMSDSLTDLLSRLAFEIRLEELEAAGADAPTPLCLGFVEIEDFSTTVAEHGDLIGDALVYRVAELVGRACESYPEAVLARYDDQRFGLLLPRCPLRHAVGLADGIRESVGAARWECKVSDPPLIISAQVRLGVTERRAGESMDGLLARTEGCLDQARKAVGAPVVIQG